MYSHFWLGSKNLIELNLENSVVNAHVWQVGGHKIDAYWWASNDVHSQQH